MGVRHLDTFARREVPGGCVSINIEEEIRKYFRLATHPDPPAPIIVIDLIALYKPLSEHDRKGLLFGGRFNVALTVIDAFFSRLKALGAKLQFFYDGPIQEPKNEVWRERQDYRYSQMLQLIDAVDRGCELDDLVCNQPSSLNFRYPLRYIARKYGGFVTSIAKECDQELAAFATKTNALAIISDDSDFLIYEGSWRYWSSRDLELSTLTTMEYNRDALAKHLGLKRNQMPLLATLCGNDVMPFDAVRRFHLRLGSTWQKFPNVARYMREHGIAPESLSDAERILKLVTGRNFVDQNLIRRFNQSLEVYKTDYQPVNINPTNDPVLEILQQEDSPFMYQIWQCYQVDVAIGVVDMRRNEFEQLYAKLQLDLIRRMAGIILYHQKPKRTSLKIVIKMSHQDPHQVHNSSVQFPTRVEPPELLDLRSKDPTIHDSLIDVKFKLLSWIASDKLDHRKLQDVPKPLRMTAFTCYYLLEAKVLKLFEADLLLQVAYDVSYEKYDPHELEYPRRLESRPFRLVFLYQKVYAFVSKAFRLVGLDDDEFRDDPPFDGVLFHKRYEDWSKQGGELEQIQGWRIYV